MKNYFPSNTNSLKKKKQTLLWKIEDPEFPGTSYVFGTMHVRDKKAFFYRDLVYEKIDACDAFATEFNLEEMDVNISSDALDLPDGKSLDTLLTEKQYRKVQKVLRKIAGMDMIHFNTSQPILIANLLAGRMLSEEMPLSLDETLWQYAREQNKITLGVETYAEQLRIMQHIPLDYQVKNLMGIVKDIKGFRKEIRKTTKQYHKADIQQLYKSVRKSVKGLRKLLLFNRNVIMADRIAEMASEQSICIAIGAGHLAGSRGVLRILKQKGLQVKPVPRPKVEQDVSPEIE